MSSNSSVSSIFDLLSDITQISAQLDNTQTFLILFYVLNIIAVVLHLFHKKVEITIGLLLLFTFVLAASVVEMRVTQNIPKSSKVAKLFLKIGQPQILGPFSIELSRIDTLKTKIKKNEDPPWTFNKNEFGKEAINDFLNKGFHRILDDYRASSKTQSQWPKKEEIWEANDEKQWKEILKKLENEDNKIEYKDTRKKIKLKKAFSKWPLAKLTIKDTASDNTLEDRYFPDHSEINVVSRNKKYVISIQSIFNGDRELGEAEGCILSLGANSMQESTINVIASFVDNLFFKNK